MPILTPCTPEGSLRCHRVDGPGISDHAGNAWEGHQRDGWQVAEAPLPEYWTALANWLRASGLLS